MKIAILTSGIRPVPAVQGGAVENLVDFYLEYNNQNKTHDITVYSVWHPEVKHHKALQSNVNHYKYIKTGTLLNKLRKYIFHRQHTNTYYNYTVEFYLKWAFSHISKQHYDIILIENRPGFVLKLKETGIPIVCHLHNDFLNCDIAQNEEIYKATSLFLNVSEYITKRVLTINPTKVKCLTLHNAIDAQRFYQAKSVKRESIGISKEDFVIVYHGRLIKEKGILQLIHAIKETSDIQNLKLLIIGSKSYGKGQMPSAFMKQLEKEAISINNNVVFTGFIDYDQVPSYLKVADIAVVPSMWEEPFGLTVVEAMAAGLPLITTRSGGIPEICEGVATIVERGNIVDNLAAAILDLYQHPEKRQQMAAASLERSKLFDKETYAKNFFKAIEEVGL